MYFMVDTSNITTVRGRRINWSRPPKPSAMVRWTHNGRTYRVSFRVACHMAWLDSEATKKFGRGLNIFQGTFSTTVAASAGSHDKDAVFDLEIPGVPWRAQETFLRARGFGCWWRFRPTFMDHIHGFCLPPREGKDVSDDYRSGGFVVGTLIDGGWSTVGKRVASSQIEDYYNHALGLSGVHHPGADKGSWYPDKISETIFDLPKFIKSQQPVSYGPNADKVIVAAGKLHGSPERKSAGARIIRIIKKLGRP